MHIEAVFWKQLKNIKRFCLYLRDRIFLRTARAHFRTQKTYLKLENFNNKKSVYPARSDKYHFEKIVWLLWLQGWDRAPWLVNQVAQSWLIQNPGWKIELVTADNLSNFVSIDYINNKNIADQAKSDIIRLNLLEKHGGVWADATMLCMQPLDNWYEFAIEPSGFWMYHGPGAKMNILEGPASWFIISRKGSYIIEKWKNECDLFWEKQKGQYHYHWMDQLFRQCFESDAEFRKQWSMVPYIGCELPGEAHSLSHGNNLLGDSAHLKQRFLQSPPFALKLSWKPWQEAFPQIDSTECRKSNGFFAIQCALKAEGLPAE